MSNPKSRRRAPLPRQPAVIQPPDRGPDRVSLLLAAAGLLLAVFLLVGQRAGNLPGCPAGGACDLVQSSRFASLLGLPVAGWGAALYAGLCTMAALRRMPWRRELLGLGSVAGLAISLYLTYMTWRELGVTCLYCQGSLLLLALLAGWSLWQARGPDAPWLLALIALLSTGAVAGMHAVHGASMPQGWNPGDPDPARLAAHLAASGARFYGASWCPHCQHQKTLFGAAAGSLPYVECSPHGGPDTPQATACLAAEITSYPTWIIGSLRRTRVMSAVELARLSSFPPEAR